MASSLRESPACVELVGDEAAGRDLDRALAGALQQVEDFLAAWRKAEERLGLQQEGAVVADVVDDGERMRDSVGRSMRTVSSSGRSRPSLKTSTAQMT